MKTRLAGLFVSLTLTAFLAGCSSSNPSPSSSTSHAPASAASVVAVFNGPTSKVKLTAPTVSTCGVVRGGFELNFTASNVAKPLRFEIGLTQYTTPKLYSLVPKKTGSASVQTPAGVLVVQLVTGTLTVAKGATSGSFQVELGDPSNHPTRIVDELKGTFQCAT